jgi:hypothetical protein
MLPPARLLDGIGTRQQALRALDGKTQFVQQAANVARVEAHAELLFDDAGYHRRSPHAGEEPVGDRSTVENVC